MSERFPPVPRYIGTDPQGDRVWELPNGRWTWGDTAEEASARPRTFDPVDYADKYGAPQYEEE